MPDAEAVGVGGRGRGFHAKGREVDEAKDGGGFADEFARADGDLLDNAVARGAEDVTVEVDLRLAKLEAGLLLALSQKFVSEPVALDLEGGALDLRVGGPAPSVGREDLLVFEGAEIPLGAGGVDLKGALGPETEMGEAGLGVE
jgi:hypothetical protein